MIECAAPGVEVTGIEQGADLPEWLLELPVWPSVDQCVAGVLSVETEDQAHRGCLSRSIGSEKSSNLSWLDGKTEMIDCHGWPIAFGQLLDGNHGVSPFIDGT
jgi:hypothetical protein